MYGANTAQRWESWHIVSGQGALQTSLPVATAVVRARAIIAKKFQVIEDIIMKLCEGAFLFVCFRDVEKKKTPTFQVSKEE
jgi:hypothetical protein